MQSSIKNKLVFAILITPLTLTLLFLLYNIYIVRQFINEKALISISETKKTLINSIFAYEKSYYEKSLKISHDVQLVVPLYYNVTYQVYDRLKTLMSQENLEALIIVNSEGKPFVSGHSFEHFKDDLKYINLPNLLINKTFFSKIDGNLDLSQFKFTKVKHTS